MDRPQDKTESNEQAPASLELQSWSKGAVESSNSTWQKELQRLNAATSEILQAPTPSAMPEIVHSALTSGLVNPAKAIAQIIDQKAGTETEKDLSQRFANLGLEERSAAQFNSSNWYQQQFGNAVGSALPFLLTRGLVKTGFAAASDAAVQKVVSQGLLKRSADEAFISGTSGLLYGVFLTPNSRDALSEGFASQRIKHGVENALLFGTIGFGAPMIGTAFGSATKSVMASQISDSLKTPLAATLNSPLSAGLTTALGAGTLTAEATAIKDGRLLPTGSELTENLVSMAFVAGALGAIHKTSTVSEPVKAPKEQSISAPNLRTGEVADTAARIEEAGKKIAGTPKEYKLAGNEEANIRNLLAGETDLKLLGKFERGTRGAWMVEDPQGRQKIFKMVDWHNDVTDQIKVSSRSAAALNAPEHPTPRFERVEFTKPFGSWYVQEKLEGLPAPAPSDRLIGQMVKMNERQAGTAVGGKDWSDQIMAALYRDQFGWQNRIASSSAEGASLVADLQRVFARNSELSFRKDDIVHGDFQHYNALVSKNDRLKGYIDWEGAGKGDRSIDLSRLLYDAYVAEREIYFPANPETLKMLNQKIKDASGRAARDNMMSYWILQVSDFGVKVGNPGMFFGVGRRILDDLHADRRQYDFARRVSKIQNAASLAMATAMP